MGCPVSTDTANKDHRKKECHADGSPLSDITQDDTSGTLHRKSTVGKIDITKARTEEVPNIEQELFMFGDFNVPKQKKPRQWPPAPTRPIQMQPGGAISGTSSSGNTTSNAVEQKPAAHAGVPKGVVWGEFKMPLIDEVEERRSVSTVSPSAEPGSPGSPTPMSPSVPTSVARQVAQQQRQQVTKPGYKTIDKFVVKNAIGHGSRVKCIAIAPGEKEYVSCSNEDTSIALFSLQSGRELGMFTGHQDTIINATFSYDGKYLATTSRDHTMILWDVVTTKQILTFEHGKVVICCCFSKDSRYVATGCQDKICRVWETRKGREVLIFAQHEGIIISMCYAPDNSHIVSASADKTLRVWSSSHGKCKFLLMGHAGIVLSCVYTADGKRIISNDEKLLRVWSAENGSCTLSLNVDDVAKVPRGNLAPSRKVTWTLSTAAPGEFGNYIIVASNNRFVYILNAETGEEVTSHFCKAPVYCLAMGHNNRAAVGDSFGNIYHFRFISHN